MSKKSKNMSKNKKTCEVKLSAGELRMLITAMQVAVHESVVSEKILTDKNSTYRRFMRKLEAMGEKF